MAVVLDLLAAIVGVLMYALCSNPKLIEIGRIMFFCGLLAFLVLGGERIINLFGTIPPR